MTDDRLYVAAMAFAISQAPRKSPELASYFAFVDPILQFAETAPGYLVPQPDLGEFVTPRFVTPEVKAHKPQIAMALYLWEDLESLLAFTYTGVHNEAMRTNHRDHWFIAEEKPVEERPWPPYALWWTTTEQCTWSDAAKRIEHLYDDGPTAYSFTFKQAFGADGSEHVMDRALFKDRKAWHIQNADRGMAPLKEALSVAATG